MKRTVILGVILAYGLVMASAGSVSADEAVDQLVKQIIGTAKSNTERAAGLYAAG